MAEKGLNRNTYLSKNVGNFPDEFEMFGRKYVKVNDLRYGTNPHQPAAYFKPAETPCVIGDMRVLKDGKSGLSQTNLEDISYALNIVKFFDRPACAVMKHVNPSGAAVQFGEEGALAAEQVEDASRQLVDEEILNAYQRAEKICGWFELTPLSDQAEVVQVLLPDPGFHLKTGEDLVQSLSMPSEVPCE